MTGLTLWQAIGLVMTFCTAVLSAAAFVRAGRWRESDDAKALTARVDAIDRRVTTIETEIKNLATKSDIATLSGKIDGVVALIVRAETAVERVEQFMMEKAR